MRTHTREYRASAVLILMNTEQVCTHTQLALLEYFDARCGRASRLSRLSYPRHPGHPRAPLAPRAPRAYPPSCGAESATSEITTTTNREKEISRSRRGFRRSARSSLPSSLASFQSVLASAVASDSTSYSSSWDWPALRYLQKYRSRMACLPDMKVFWLK